MIKLFGTLDILTGISLILLNFGSFNWSIGFFLVYLLIKSIIFFADFLSIIDLIIVVFAFILIFTGDLNFFLLPAGVYLIGKGFFSII